MSKTFIVKGKAKIGIDWVNFKKQVTAPKKERAIDNVLCMLGGNHKLKRFQIKIESVEEQAGT
ncbi:MAG: 50S ribosomal protein L18Ae [Candidatus Methanomethyliaceae archaeon]|nr:50S ribosomal protein L18Ae [Candidatus Methanomethyliaceae archaeon]